MNITKSDVAKFQALYKKHFGKDIDYQEAFKQLTLLVRQMEIVYQPISIEMLDRFFGLEDKITEDKTK